MTTEERLLSNMYAALDKAMPSRVCAHGPHGQLARSCELCERDARIKELEAVLREYMDAADQCLSGADDIANMLRFGAADKSAREALK